MEGGKDEAGREERSRALELTLLNASMAFHPAGVAFRVCTSISEGTSTVGREVEEFKEKEKGRK